MTASDTKEPPSAEEKLGSLDIKRIMELLPHRYPMLMIDRIEDIKPGISATGVKNVTANEPFFLGHFPGHPIMPGVLIVEAMAQTAGALVKHSLGTERADEVVYFMTIDKAKFRKPVVPGDTLKLHVNLIRERAPVWRFAGEGRVGGELRAEAEFSAMIMSVASEPPRES